MKSVVAFIAVISLASSAFVKFDHFDEGLWKDQEAVLELVERMKDDESQLDTVSTAAKCDPSKCKLPNCHCSGWDIPGGLAPKDIPQMIVLTFQNAVSPQNYIPYTRIFSRRNPNNCPATGTFFVSHSYTDYYQVQSLWAAGHEIGDNTVTGGSPSEWDKQKWTDEILEQREMLKKFAHIPEADVRGFRAPLLNADGDVTADILKQNGFTYDSSRTTVQFRKQPKMMWPYTYDFLSEQDCTVPPCPTESHPGLWELPIPAIDGPDGAAWATLGSINFKNESQVVEYLLKKFEDAYNGNRAPLTIVVDTMFVIKSFKMDGFLKFLDSIQRLYKDVYLVSGNQAIEWLKNPTPASRVSSFKPWGCDSSRTVCDEKAAITCWYDDKRRQVKEGGVWKMHWCSTTCPKCYPTFHDVDGNSC